MIMLCYVMLAMMKVVEMEELLTVRRRGRRKLRQHCSGGEGGAMEARR